jgi:hypothetical protein
MRKRRKTNLKELKKKRSKRGNPRWAALKKLLAWKEISKSHSKKNKLCKKRRGRRMS